MKPTNLLKLKKVKFPKQTGIVINMMPFIIGDAKSIPKEYRHYYKLINKCPIDANEYGKVGYLSIVESLVEKGTSQRRPGIHTDKPGKLFWGGGWGSGKLIDGGHIKGGIFMASNVANSCRAWDQHIDYSGTLGDCEHLRDSLVNEHVMEKDTLYWMTDSCPHESLALQETTFRQWFRFVTSQVSLWYRQHSTPNRLGILPPCHIIEESKF